MAYEAVNKSVNSLIKFAGQKNRYAIFCPLLRRLYVFMNIKKYIASNLVDRLSIGLLSAITFLIFYLIMYGIMFITIGGPAASGNSGELTVVFLKLFLWGISAAFIIGFIFLINPIELVLNYFNEK